MSDDDKRLYDLVSDQIKHVHTAYKWLGGLLALIIVAGGYFFYTNTNDLRSGFERETRTMRERAHDDVEDYKRSIESRLSADTEQLRKKISDRIDEEFKSENIRTLVDRKARERIDAVADELISEQIEKRISPQITRQEKELQDLELRLFQTMALNDNRDAYDTLCEWANSLKSPFKKQATEAIEHVKKEYGGLKFPAIAVGIVMMGDKKFPILTFDEFTTDFPGASKADKENLISALWDRTDFTDKQKLSFMTQIIKRDGSLKIVSIASNRVISRYKLTYHCLDIADLIAWCNEHL